MPKGKVAHKCQHGLDIKDCPPCKSVRQKAWYERYCEKRGGRAVVNEDRKEIWQKQKVDPEYMEYNRKRGREFWAQLRDEVIRAYGGYVCACCEETEPLFLEIDHINNDGAEHRRAMGYKGNGKGASSCTLTWLKANGFPGGFQILCANCNKGKARNGGICPHKTKTCKEHSE